MNDGLIRILHEGRHSLVVANNGIHTFDGRGVSDLYRIFTENPGLLHGAAIADKVVGKGAAALMISGQIDSLYADVISVHALELFEATSIKVSFGTKVENIINRTGDEVCPVETMCLPCVTAQECLPLIEKFISNHT